MAIEAPDHFVGSSLLGSRNVISGNNTGILISGTGGNDVHGNYIGLSATGLSTVPNGTGVDIASPDNWIGGPASDGLGNVISGNSISGITIRGLTARDNRVEGNRIGTDPAGTLDLGNGIGIHVTGGGTGLNTIGGVLGETGNLISGNNEGIRVSATAGHIDIWGNQIGTNLAGTAALPNTVGIRAEGDGGDIGSIALDERNVISGNTTHGIDLRAHGYLVYGNYIGTTADRK